MYIYIYIYILYIYHVLIITIPSDGGVLANVNADIDSPDQPPKMGQKRVRSFIHRRGDQKQAGKAFSSVISHIGSRDRTTSDPYTIQKQTSVPSGQ